jgi:hypothetical protein
MSEMVLWSIRERKVKKRRLAAGATGIGEIGAWLA